MVFVPNPYSWFSANPAIVDVLGVNIPFWLKHWGQRQESGSSLKPVPWDFSSYRKPQTRHSNPPVSLTTNFSVAALVRKGAKGFVIYSTTHGRSGGKGVPAARRRAISFCFSVISGSSTAGVVGTTWISSTASPSVDRARVWRNGGRRAGVKALEGGGASS